MAEKCLIVGLGQVGMGYDLLLDPKEYIYTHARAFSLHPAFDLAGAVDPDPKQRALFQKHFSKPPFEDLAEALQECAPAVVIVANPTAGHRAAVESILEHSHPTAILCEKPLAYDLEDARAISRLCEHRGVKLFVNYMRRSDPGAIEVKRCIESGQIKNPIRGIVWYSKGFIHNGSHFFNLVEYWLGALVAARVVERGRLWDDHDPEPLVQVQFARGAVTFVPAWEESFSHCTVELISQNGRLYYGRGGEAITWQAARPDPCLRGYTTLSADPEFIESGRKQAQWHVADQLDVALRGRSAEICSGDQAVETLERMYRLLEE